MNLVIQCGACQASLKVADRLAGKKVKCPKCGQAIAVPAGAEAITAAKRPQQPVRSASPPTGGAAPPVRPVRLPLLSFDELNVPARLRRSIEKEVGGEELLWLDRPSPESLLRKAKFGMVAGLVIIILLA